MGETKSEQSKGIVSVVHDLLPGHLLESEQ